MNWFTPKCPVNEEEKKWLEDGFLWLIEEFGADTLHHLETVLPTDEFFPDEFSADVPSLRKMLYRICSYMSVNVEDVELRVFTNDEKESPHPLIPVKFEGDQACGLYRFYRGKHHVSIETKLLSNPTNLIATISHELAHARLIGEDRLDPDYEDHELLTDLTTIFFGFGVFTANSLFSFEQWTNSSYQGWQTSRQGYITEEMAGYALALFAYLRGESKPEWRKFLEGSAKHYFKSGLKYLERTGDTSLRRFRQS
jgi:hypothetical protein